MKEFELNRENTVLLVIDIQEKLLPAVLNQEEVVKNTQILLELAKVCNIPVLATEQYPKGLGMTIAPLRDYLMPELIYEKTEFTGYSEKMAAKLEELKAKNIVVVGMENHICVLQTVRSLKKAGYEVFVAADAVSSRTQQNKEVGLQYMRDMGALITCTETVIFDILKKAGGLEFKHMSKLIK